MAQKYPTEEQIKRYEMLESLLASITLEMKEFSKKKPDELLNKYKVKIINRNLTPIKEILAEEPTIGYLDLLDEDTLPSNSDAVLILGQFSSAMEQFRNKFYKTAESTYTRRWLTKENPPPAGKNK